MRPLKILFTLTGLLFASCSDSYEQHYDTFADFSKANARNKSWFPDIIGDDAFDLKNESYLDSLCAFGTFYYSNDKYYDSIFIDPSVEQIDYHVFQEKVTAHSDRRPGWFDDLPHYDPKENFITMKVKRFYITKDYEQKKIYYILSN